MHQSSGTSVPVRSVALSFLSAQWFAVWLTAFMAGLLGSGHCFAMCGGIAGGLGTLTHKAGSRAGAFVMALQFNSGRLIAYTLAGAFAAGLLGIFPNLSGLEFLGALLRSITALLVALIGMRYLLEWRGLDFIERLGARFWPKISPIATRLAASPGPVNRLLLGLCWGFLPCGLVYTLLLTAASTGHAIAGAGVMLAFGLGTLPSMLGLTLAAPAIASVLRDTHFRRFIGLSLILLAIWMVISLYSMGGFNPGEPGSGHHH
ncbi:MAG: sulfite exporter TauE/SafE family protein [Xanthomonadales bacterium]|nr:sulfite exporter TauE/SafE family protein [Xanthomonadales bacterium]